MSRKARKAKGIVTKILAVFGVLLILGLVSSGIAYLASDTFADNVDSFVKSFDKKDDNKSETTNTTTSTVIDMAQYTVVVA